MAQNKDSESSAAASEWSYFFDVATLDQDPVQLTITPEAEETALLIKRLDLLSLEDMQVDMVLARAQGGMAVHVKGQIKARVSQPCVVTLAPVLADINEAFEAWFADTTQAVSLAKVRHKKQHKGESPMLSEHDDPEPVSEDGMIDLGELATQYLSLALDPYPHAEGVSYEDGQAVHADESDSDQRGSNLLKNPFAALKEWKDRQR